MSAKIKPEHLKIETLSPTPSSGQQCGIMPIGVKVTHLPSGLTASCSTERSQMQNKKVAIAMIEYGLAEIGAEL